MASLSKTELSAAQRALRNLRHLYEQMVDGHVKNCKEAATGLLGPAIELIENVVDDQIV